MTRILVTGGSGFIGTNIVEHYFRLGHQVVSVDTSPPRCTEHTEVWRDLDVLDASAMRRIVEETNPEVVFHMAAKTDLEGRSPDDYRANTAGTANVVAALLHAQDLQRVVFASSMLVCRLGYAPRDDTDYCPTTPYGRSKVDAEGIVRSMAGGRLPWVIVRPTSIWGPWFGSPYRDFFEIVRRGLYFHPKNVLVKRSYGYVGNVVHSLDRLCSPDGTSLIGRTIYVADYEPIDVKAWADVIAKEFGVRPVRQIPEVVFHAGAHVGDLLGRLGIRAPMTTFRLNNMLTQMIVDIGPVKSLSDTLPYSVDEGVRSTCAWLRTFG